MTIDTYLDNQINAYLARPEYDYQLYDSVADSDFSSLLGDNSQKTLNVLKTNSSEFENATIDNLVDHLVFDFMTGDYCNMPFYFNSDILPELDKQIKAYCDYILEEMESE